MSQIPQPNYRLIHGIKVTQHEPREIEPDAVESVTYNYYDDKSDEPHDLEIPRYQLA